MRSDPTPAQSRDDVHVGVFDLFRIGIGPSSSHTVGPMRAAAAFLTYLAGSPAGRRGDRITCDLFGSLALTAQGHATDVAVVAGLAGALPETVDPDELAPIVSRVTQTGKIQIDPDQEVTFIPARDLVLHRKMFLPVHPNALTFTLWEGDAALLARTYYSIGGGFLQTEGDDPIVQDAGSAVPFRFTSAEELLAIAHDTGLTIAAVARRNELTARNTEEINRGLDEIWSAMQACVERGLRGTGVLPGGLAVKRRAHPLHLALQERQRRNVDDPLRAMEWVNVYALAVNEENAAGGRVVTAPTNGAAGIIPAVLHYYRDFVPGASLEGVRDFLLTAAAVGAIIKRNASISGADVGCQGEVGSAAAMAAAGLTAALGGTSLHIENAAEVALEHSLGLTCDPVGGLVQIPCIERNAVAAVKAINAARLTLLGDGTHRVTLDQVIETMRQTGKDMSRKYKETAEGGLAVNVPMC